MKDNSSRTDSGHDTGASFLDSVATAYAARYKEMSDVCFVFPNKRSCTFFLNSLASALGSRAMLAPEVMDISEFVSRISGREPASRLDMLFMLYKVYCSLLGRTESLQTAEDLLDFDRFAPWGETVLGDFSEVDKYDVDAEAIFTNVRDYRDIASNFLTEEQLTVIERYFGYRPVSEDVERFWRTVTDEEELSRLKEKFVELWRLLPELYEGLNTGLDAVGMATPGRVFRLAAERISGSEASDLPWTKVVAVGFNMLSTTEAEIFGTLRDMKDSDGEPVGEFFWDATGPVLGLGSKSKGAATKTIRRNMKLFPSPEWAESFMQRAERTEMPSITVAAAPSNASQTKIAALTVEDWISRFGIEKVSSPRTAVVVPDENLLMPLLHSLPNDIGSVNLTMGYSMRYTSVASFIYHLRRLQERRRKSGGQPGYLRDDIQLLLSHPLVHVLIGSEKANFINGEIGRLHLRVVTVEWLGSQIPELAEILKPIESGAGVEEVTAYIEGVLLRIDEALSRGKEGLRTVNSKIERSQILVYRIALTRLEASVRQHGIEMSWRSVFHLIDRLVAGETVAFEGEPLEGLQVMGLLETRALDFNHLIILSMNDSVMPRHSRHRTFIPDALRHGYGLPTAARSEELYSYYFYRLLSRAKEVTLLYDARAGEGMRSGGKSRFLLQLEMLYAPGQIRNDHYTFGLSPNESRPEPVEKTPAVMKMLEDFRTPEKGRNLSASALMDYCKCPVMFYYKDVVKLSDESDAKDYIDAITQGNIVHNAMVNLYFPEKLQGKYLRGGQRIILTASDIESILADESRIGNAVKRAVNKEHYHLPDNELDRALEGTVQMVAERLMVQIREVVRHDLTLAPIELIGGEMKGDDRLKLGNAPEVNIRYAFDRVDRIAGSYRIVDYKTGSSHVNAKEEEDLFNGNHSASYMLQLLLYARLLTDRVRKEEGLNVADVEMHIYDVNTISTSGSVRPVVKRQTIMSHSELDDIFIPGIERILTEIFNPEQPFEPTAEEDNCTYCAFKALCGKE
ncbi:MAG: PD-(D/E)XK nuclease family protein [Muribaculaceae bacterium]|nr:PD-(D/E)XK nuclease family protein [Muribaculaceae bacterium]